MLCELRIRNIALIDELTLELGPGFSAVTGETGAGKSIVVDSMNLALGERADRELIRSGTEKARVEALFDISSSPRAQEILNELGIDFEGGQLIVTRELSTSGRNVCRINGSLQPLAALRRLTSAVVDLHGQHEHQLLLDETQHIEYIDAYGGEKIEQLKEAVKGAYQIWALSVRRLRRMTGSAADRAKKTEELTFQINEIESLNPVPGEEAELLIRREKLRNAVTIHEALYGANVNLNGSGDEPGAVAALHESVRFLQELETFSPEYARLAAALSDAAFAAQDAASGVGEALFSLGGEGEGGETALDKLEDRIAGIEALKRKYGGDIESALAKLDQLKDEMDKHLNADEDAKKLEAVVRANRRELVKHSLALTARRRECAKNYENEVLSHLCDLGMEKARFCIEIKSPEAESRKIRFTPEGFDEVRFLFSANAGEEPKPLSRIASGGETSRVMLALKNVAADYGDVGCLIFDEIDTGISGRMAQVVGEKMARIAKKRQIISVTHLPQIACMADKQFIVYKEDEKGRAKTNVRPLDEKGRVREIARLVGGAGDEATALEHASSMLKAAENRKATL